MGTQITLTAADGHTLAAYRADPEGTPRGAIVVVQEIFGVNQHIRAVTDSFAADGYVALAPAFFDRSKPVVELDYTPEGMTTGRELAYALDWNNTVADVSAAAGALRQYGKVGLVGYCWGGSVAWLAACRSELDCAVSYYGGRIIDTKDATPNCPTMLHFGDADKAIPIDDVEAIKAAHPDMPIHRYADAEHGFNCDIRASYHAESAKIARERT
ncbi:MAG TPA: dienelactone hydrolase family protein, partial [Alphaproteobacteria bacterium]|nr:dienelactone hydrolase family protein [Alphaproteobacteria bacterium]